MEPTKHVREVVRLSELAMPSPRIANHHFQDCLLLGPVVIAMTGNGAISNCQFDGPPDEILWEIPSGRQSVVGAIEAADCTFESCRFSMVGFAGPKDFAEMFRGGVSG